MSMEIGAAAYLCSRLYTRSPRSSRSRSPSPCSNASSPSLSPISSPLPSSRQPSRSTPNHDHHTTNTHSPSPQRTTSSFFEDNSDTYSLRLFSLSRPPQVPLHAYITRFTKLGLPTNALPLACILLARACAGSGTNQPHLVLTATTIHRALLAAILVSAKFLVDDFTSQSAYALAGGVRNYDLYALEISFLRLISFDVWVDPIEYSIVHDEIEMLQTEKPPILVPKPAPQFFKSISSPTFMNPSSTAVPAIVVSCTESPGHSLPFNNITSTSNVSANVHKSPTQRAIALSLPQTRTTVSLPVMPPRLMLPTACSVARCRSYDSVHRSSRSRSTDRLPFVPPLCTISGNFQQTC